MPKHVYLLVLILILLASCRPIPSPTPPPTDTVSPTFPAAKTAAAQPTSTAVSLPPTSTSVPASTPTSGPALPPFTIDWSQPFDVSFPGGEAIRLIPWTPQSYAGAQIALPFQLSQVANNPVLSGLTEAELTFLAQNGFVVVHTQETQFGDIRLETAAKTGQPYYLTTDAAYHALHLLFDDLLKALEREFFRPQLISLTRAAADQLLADSQSVQGTPLQAETSQSLAYLSVALRLFDPNAAVDPSVADLVTQQVDQITAAGGRAKSVLFPDFEDDYGAYRPVGHYAGDPDLEAYFRAMTWFGRMHFLLADPSNPNFIPSRLPLIVTLELRRSQADGQPASDLWASLHRDLTFVIGPSDDLGPLEYASLMDQVYGTGPSLADLGDPDRWQSFLSGAGQLPSPQINSLFVASTRDLSPTTGWRFMGQRFTLDGLVLQNVIFDRVQAKPDGSRRNLPSGLDVMAAFGSASASQELQTLGVTAFPNYPQQLEKMQQAVQSQPEQQWLGRFYDGWLYSFVSLLQHKDSAYPVYMQQAAWGYKELNTALGSWAELKHDTILYTKMPERAGGGGPPTSYYAPSYVEPVPQTFYRLAYIASTLSCGLQDLVLLGPCGSGPSGEDAAGYIYGMYDLGSTFQALEDIAARELAGQPLTQDENEIIGACLGMTECIHIESPYNRPSGPMPKVPVIAAVAGSQDSVLEAGVGLVDRIYVLLPLEGKSEVAQGGVFSYYEFTQPRDQRLTDDEWRARLAAGPVDLPAWARNFVLTGGAPVQSLYFRVGDVYIVNAAGDKLNLRDKPSLGGAVLGQAMTGDYLTILEGPVQADGYTWWRFEQGWAVENPDWYERSYLP